MNSKPIRTAYGVIAPIFIITLLLGFASFNTRPMVLSSATADLIIRLLLTIWFCGLYIRLPRLSSYRINPQISWSKTDIQGFEKAYYIGLGFLFGLGAGIITYWTIQWFLPSLSNSAAIIAAINGLVISLPLASKYWVLKV